MPTTQEMDLGQLLVERRLATADQIRECLAIQSQLNGSAHLGAILVKKGYVSEQHARQALALLQSRDSSPADSNLIQTVARPNPNGSGVHVNGSQAGAVPNEDVDGRLARLLSQRQVVPPAQLQAACDLLRQYRAAGHQNVSLARILVQRGLLDETRARQALAMVQGGQPGSNGASPGASGHGYGVNGSGAGVYGSGPMAAPQASGYGNGIGGVGSGPMAAVHQSGPFAAPAPAPAPGPVGPQPILNVMSQTMAPPGGSGGFELVSDTHSGQSSAFTPMGKIAQSGVVAPLETCISPDDPIAQKMRTVKKPDGSYEIVFGPYDILGEVARGGMGIVYRARQRDLKRIVALKVMKDGENASQKQIRRFRRETEAAAKLQHPNIVAVHEVGCIEGFHFFTMDLIEGDPLDVRVKRGELPGMKEAVTIVKEVSQAIHYAHSKKIVHRDLKPANVLMDLDGHPKVTDFGLAKNVDHKSNLTRTGAVVGTPYYMPPEQARGDMDIDARCDVYALGVILYELLTGKLPFRGETTMEVYHKILEEEPLSPRHHNSRIPRDLEVITLKAMEKERSRRYQTARDLAEDLQRYLDGEPIKARPLGPIGKLVRKARKNKSAVLLGTAGVTMLLACGSFFAYRYVDRAWHDHYVKSRHEWDNYTAELENQLIRARGLISAASAKNKDGKGERALQDLQQAQRTLGLLPKILDNEEVVKHNPRARAGLYVLCLDGSFREKLFSEGGVPREGLDVNEAVETARGIIEASEVLTSQPPLEDDPFGDMDDTVYLGLEPADLSSFLTFVQTSSVDLGAAGEEMQAYRVESPLPTKDLRHFYRDIYRERGHAYRSRGDELGYKRALAEYRKALEYDSRSREAMGIRLEIGKVLAASNELDKALEHFKAIIAEDDKYSPAYLERGHISRRLGRYEEAIRDYKQVIENELEPVEAYLARGRTFMEVGQPARGLQDFEQVIELKDDSFWGYLERGRAHMALGNAEEAEQDLTEAVDLNAARPEGYAARAELYTSQRKLDEAVKEFETALIRGGGDGDVTALMGLARVYELQLDPAEAEKQLRRVLEKGERIPAEQRVAAHIALGRLLAVQSTPRLMEAGAGGASAVASKRKEAFAQLEAALKLAPQHPEGHAARGRLLLAEGRVDEAAAALDVAIEAEAEWNRLVKRFEDPEAVWDDGFESTGRNAREQRKLRQASLLGLRGLLAASRGDAAKARELRERAVALSDKVAAPEIIEALLSGEDAQAAAKAYNASLRRFNRSASDNIGEAGEYFAKARENAVKASDSRKQEVFGKSREAFARVLFLNPYHSLAWFERGRMELDWGQTTDGAVDDVSEAINRNPFLQQAWEFRGFLYARDLPASGEGLRYTLNPAKAQGDFNRAVELAEELVAASKAGSADEVSGKLALAHAYYGRALATLGEEPDASPELLGRALTDLEAGIAAAPKDEPDAEALRNKILYHERRAEVLNQLGREEDAREDLAAAEGLREKGIKKAQDLYNQGRDDQDKRRYDAAIEKFTRAIEFNDGFSDAFYNRGLCFLKIGNFIPGILDFSRALELNPRFADQFYNKVYQVNYVVDLKRVMDELNKIVEERPNVSYVIFLRGFFYVAKSEFKEYEPSDLDKGIADFDRTLELNPTHVTAFTYRGLLYHKKVDFVSAHRDFDKAISLDSESGITFYLKSLAYATECGKATGERQKELQSAGIETLRKAFKNGFRGYDRISKEQAFENLESNPLYKELLDKFRP